MTPMQNKGLERCSRMLCLSVFLVCLFFSSSVRADSTVNFIDAVVASVNGVPITLSDVVERSGEDFPHSLSEASKNEKIQFTLQQLITEHLLKAEARERRIGVNTEELDRYIERVAEQNGLSASEFEQALKNEGKTLTEYRKQVELDILRTKLASSLMRAGITVGESEINEYIEQHPELRSEGAKIKLRQVVYFKEQTSAEKARKALEEIKAGVSSVEDFAKAAREYSQGSEAAEGGLLGVLSEEELSGDIFDALFKLPENGMSDVIETGAGYHLFFIENRFVAQGDEEDSETFREEIRAQLEQRKMDEKLRLYFAQELSTKFAVDKKI